jgi:antitoxin VapB
MKTAKLFKIGKSCAVKLPNGFRFEGNEVFIKRVGSSVILTAKNNFWDVLEESLECFTPDFMAERK